VGPVLRGTPCINWYGKYSVLQVRPLFSFSDYIMCVQQTVFFSTVGFWVATLCGLVGGYLCFRGKRCDHTQRTISPKRRWPTQPHSVITKKKHNRHFHRRNNIKSHLALFKHNAIREVVYDNVSFGVSDILKRHFPPRTSFTWERSVSVIMALPRL
jgi:hypothetical protein